MEEGGHGVGFVAWVFGEWCCYVGWQGVSGVGLCWLLVAVWQRQVWITLM